MKLLILGITGRTGTLVADEAIRRGHKVIGIARDSARVKVENAEIINGTPYDNEIVRKAITGCDAVISTLNVFRESQSLFGKIKTPLDIMSVSIKNTINAMEEKGISRIVVMTALGVGETAKQLPAFFTFLLKISNIKHAYTDHAEQEKLLEKSTLDWTIVRPVGLTDRNDNLSILYNLNGNGRITSSISRNAVAHFILDCIDKKEFIKQKPAISNE